MTAEQALAEAIGHASAARALFQILQEEQREGMEQRHRWQERLTNNIRMSQMYAALSIALPTEPQRCWSCDHEVAAHEAAGCNYEVAIGDLTKSRQCLCEVGVNLGQMVPAGPVQP